MNIYYQKNKHGYWASTELVGLCKVARYISPTGWQTTVHHYTVEDDLKADIVKFEKQSLPEVTRDELHIHYMLQDALFNRVM